MSEKNQYRSIFISDLHLGTDGCNTELLLDFLKNHKADNWYLVGDIIDVWAAQAGRWNWKQSHNDVITRILKKAHNGAKIYYIIGNHDEVFRSYIEGVSKLGHIEVANEFVHETANGKKYLVIHGDLFDYVFTDAKWLAYIGDFGYHWLLRINKIYNRYRKFRGKSYWSFSRYVKENTKIIVDKLFKFEKKLCEEAKFRDLNGVICGHSHCPSQKMINDIEYHNTGDFVESCTAILEHQDGTLELVEWLKESSS